MFVHQHSTNKPSTRKDHNRQCYQPLTQRREQRPCKGEKQRHTTQKQSGFLGQQRQTRKKHCSGTIAPIIFFKPVKPKPDGRERKERQQQVSSSCNPGHRLHHYRMYRKQQRRKQPTGRPYSFIACRNSADQDKYQHAVHAMQQQIFQVQYSRFHVPQQIVQKNESSTTGR